MVLWTDDYNRFPAIKFDVLIAYTSQFLPNQPMVQLVIF